MPVVPARPRGLEARHSLLRAQALLEEALQLIDDHADAPDLGARLQDVVDRLKAQQIA